MNNTTIVIFSDPKTGSDEALGRLFNGFAAAYDIKQQGGNVSIVFQGAGTRWTSHITQADHPAHELYKSLKDNIVGVSCGCADIFGATDDAVKNGFDLIKESPIPGTSGVPSVGKLLKSNTTILTF
jgi:hypothetical protein